MRQEVDSAVEFIAKILSTHGIRLKLDSERIESFRRMLMICMYDHYQNHWFPDKPFKGSAYRCLRIVNQKMDPLIIKAGAEIGLTESQLLDFLPAEFTMWVDPSEVSYRIGEEGSIGVLYGDDSSSDDSSDSPVPTPPSGNDFSSSQELLQSCKGQIMSNNYSNGMPSQDSSYLGWDSLASYVSS